MRPASRTLDATYRTRAIPTGSARYWSWLFAASETRAPLLGIYALQAEWSALMDPASERDAARIKLAWWQEETRRMAAGKPVHPIGIYLAALPRAASAAAISGVRSTAAALAEADGTPLERSADLEPHAWALRANPWAVASRLAGDLDEPEFGECSRALAMAEYLSRAIGDYRRQARCGRVPFAVEELLAASIDTVDLSQAEPPAHLAAYLQLQRERAAQYFSLAASALPPGHRNQQRHLLILAALGLKRLQQPTHTPQPRGLRDMLLAWTTARHANRSI